MLEKNTGFAKVAFKSKKATAVKQDPTPAENVAPVMEQIDSTRKAAEN